MRSRTAFRLIVLLSIHFSRLDSATPAAQIGPNPDFVDAVWLAKSNRVLKIAAADGASLLEIADGRKVQVVATDEMRGLLWAFGDNILRSYSFSGMPLSSTPIPNLVSGDDEEGENGKNLALVVSRNSGNVWLGIGKRLLQFQLEARLVQTLALPANVRHLATDHVTSLLWVATKETVSAVNEAGKTIIALSLGKDVDIQDIAVDAESGQLWVATKKSLFRYLVTGALGSEIKVDDVRSVATAGQGSVWAVTEKELIRLNFSGKILAKVELKKDNVVDLVSDTFDSSAWIASESEIDRISADGRILYRIEFKGPSVRDVALYVDNILPVVQFNAPTNGAYINSKFPNLKVSYTDIGSGVNPVTLQFLAGATVLTANCSYAATTAICAPATALPESMLSLSATVRDWKGNLSQPASTVFTIDTIPPTIRLQPPSPADGAITNQLTQNFLGQVSEPAGVTINGQNVTIGVDLKFQRGPVLLTEGANVFEFVATDRAGNVGSLTVRVMLDTVPPAAVDTGKIQVGPPKDGQVTIIGKPGSVEPGSNVTITNLRTGQSTSAKAGADGAFVASLAAQGGDRLSIVVNDLAGNASPSTGIQVIGGLPPNPATVAPAIDRTVTTSFASATAFLYAGSNPIQTGVTPGTIQPKRAAVLRGRTGDLAGAPLSGVQIRIVGHPEFGQTLSREDGMFDLAVNGGSRLTISYQKDGYLSSQRSLDVPWQDYVFAPEVFLVLRDTKVTSIDLNATSPIQVARGNPTADMHGTRQATLFFSQATQAQLILPSGQTQPITNLSVRATEYSVGTNGPKAMPAELPPSSAYTYAVEFSVDEADTAGATDVTFSRPVSFYLENFLNFPVGGIVPAGFYHRAKAIWIPSNSGRIIKVVSTDAGIASLDIDGGGAAGSPQALAALGISDAERQQLATLYQPGRTLWRVPIDHFTSWDCNWPRVAPAGTESPSQPSPQSEKKLKSPCEQEGSIIECQNQILGQAVGITGTAFSLNYRSDRVPGRIASSSLDIPLIGSVVPAGLKRIELRILIAGQEIFQSFSPAPNLSYSFLWDGRDAYGRLLQGQQPVTTVLVYVYEGVYSVPVTSGASFGAASGVPISGFILTRDAVSLGQVQRSVIGGIGVWDARAQALGGWDLNLHHTYDPVGKTLYLGDGSRRSAVNINRVIDTVAGTGSFGFGGDGGPAIAALIRQPKALVVGGDGSFYIADSANSRVRRVTADGVITTVAGTGTSGGFSGDGGPATQAQLLVPRGIALAPDGTLYIADSFNNRIRKVDPNGIITTIAGNGVSGYGGDGGPATAASLAVPSAVALGPDGSVYIADLGNFRVRRVDPNGIITTFAGTGLPDDGSGNGGDGGPATQAKLRPADLFASSEGNVHIADNSIGRIRRVGADGIIKTVAGKFGFQSGGDGGPALDAVFKSLEGVGIGLDGTIYVLGDQRVRAVSPERIVTTIAGTGEFGFDGDGGPAPQAKLNAERIAVSPDGTLYVADRSNNRIRRISTPMPGFSSTDIVLPSEDGSQLYKFDPSGRHVGTFNSLTGAVLYQFRYDNAGRLIQIEDGDHNITNIERDLIGNPTAVVAPFGQRTSLLLDTNGYLAGIINPANEKVSFSYTPSGLMTELVDPKGNRYQYSYDSVGRLSRDTDPSGGSQSYTRSVVPGGFEVTRVTGLNRVTRYRVENLPTGELRLVTTGRDGSQAETRIGANGGRLTTQANGTVFTLLEGPDPRFGMKAPLLKATNMKTPSGLLSTFIRSRTVALADPKNPLSLQAMTDVMVLNGRSFKSVFDATTRTFTDTSPSGRQTFTTVDGQGRILTVQIAGLVPANNLYDNRGRIISTTLGTGADTRTTSFTYNSAGYLEILTDPLGRTGRFQYDSAGRMTGQTLADDRPVGYAYDANGNLVSVTPPGRPPHNFVFSPVNLRSEYAPPDIGAGTNRTQLSYNLDRQPANITRPDAQTVVFGYDSAGRLASLATPQGQIGYAYNTSGDLMTITAPDGGTVTYSYDGGLLVSTLWAGPINGSVGRAYDNSRRVTALKINDANVLFQYDDDNLLTQAGDLTLTRNSQNGLLVGTSLGNVTDAWTYNGFAEPTNYVASYNGTPLYGAQYARDKLGRITAKTEMIGAVNAAFGYGYDQVGRLAGVTRDGVTTATYTYDTNSNRATQASPGGTASATYDSQDRLTQYGTTRYNYTTNGELTSKINGSQTTLYQYDVLGNLKGVTLPDGTQVEYLVDGTGRRIGKKVNGVLVQGFLYQNGINPVAELDGSSKMIALFVYGSRAHVPDYMVKGGITYRIVTDHLGSPRLIVNAMTGEIAHRLDYDEFGNITLDTNPGFQPFGFAGGIYDRHTKSTRFGTRDYDAEVGRWTAKDLIGFGGGDTNLYGYVLNDPINSVDPPGLWEKDVHQGAPGQTYGTYTWARLVGMSDFAARTIGAANIGVDNWGNTSPYASPWDTNTSGRSRHFDLPLGGPDSRDDWARIEMENAIRAWKQGDCLEAYNALGRGLHSIQDKYAHGDWNNEDWPYWWHALGGPQDNWNGRPEVQGAVVKESIAYLKQFLNASK